MEVAITETNVVVQGPRIVTRLPTRAIEMQWDIEDFKILLGLEDGLERIRLPFEFGPETGIKSRWEFFFCKDSRGWMGFWLKMLKFEETNINVEVSGRLESQGAIELAQRDSDIEFADSTPETYFSHGTFRSANLTHVVFPNMAKGLKCSYICPTNLHSILTEGTLALRLKFTVFLNKFVDTVKEPACAGIKAKSVCRLNQQNLMLAMFLEGIGSDVTILTRDDQHVKAHKCILSASSSVFRAMFSTQMSEKEAGMVEMSDIGSQALNVFLRFCYTGEIEDNWGEFYAELIYAADKYDMPLLMDFFDNMLPTLCTKENCLDLAKVANLHKLGNAKEHIKRVVARDVDLFIDRLLQFE